MIDIEEKKIEPKPEPIRKIRGKYFAKGIKWKFKKILYPDYEPMLKIINQVFSEYNSAFKNNGQEFMQMIQKILELKLIPSLFKIILEPDNSNPFRAVINRYRIRKYKINSENIIQHMDDEIWRKILFDFFILSGRKIESLLPTGSISRLMNLMTKLQSLEPLLENLSRNHSTENIVPMKSDIRPPEAA